MPLQDVLVGMKEGGHKSLSMASKTRDASKMFFTDRRSEKAYVIPHCSSLIGFVLCGSQDAVYGVFAAKMGYSVTGACCQSPGL